MAVDSASGYIAAVCVIILLLMLAPVFAWISAKSESGRFWFTAAIYIRIFIAIASAYHIFLTADSDQLDFHNAGAYLATGALTLAQIADGSRLYTLFLAGLYSLFGPSILLGNCLGIVAFAISLHYLLKMLRLLTPTAPEASAIFFFGFSPAMLLFDNFTFREPFQILFFICGLYNGLLYRKSYSLGRFSIMTGCVAAFAYLHQAFFIMAPVVLIAVILFPREHQTSGVHHKKQGLAETAIVTIMTAIGIPLFYQEFSNFSVMQVLLEGNVAEAMNHARVVLTTITTRTLLPFQVQSTGTLELIAKLPLIYFQFMFAPILPLIMSAPRDIVAMIDTAMRATLLFSSYSALRHSRGERRKNMLMLFSIYLVFALIAALGTASVGTEMRHQVKASWILVLLGSPLLWFQTRRSKLQVKQTNSVRKAIPT